MPLPDEFKINSLALFKSNPAIITGSDDKKVELTTPFKSGLKVRHKDVFVLHAGPVSSLSDIKPVSGDVDEACELLSGENTTIPELAELMFGSHTPSGSWEIVKLLQDGLYCSGSVEDIKVHTSDERALLGKKRAETAAKKEDWENFITGLRSGKLAEEDSDKLGEVEAVALKKSDQSPVLKALGLPCSYESAHQLLLKFGVWDEFRNPYPERFGLPESGMKGPSNVDINEALSGVTGLESKKEDRVDLTHLPAYAIDDKGNKDPDDALSIEGEKLWIHISDVSSVVIPESQTDLAAREVGSTAYFPEEVRNMLPSEVTEYCGLGLQTTSPSLSFGITLAENGAIDKAEIHTALVKVTRVSYSEVEDRMDEADFAKISAFTEKYRQYRKSQNAVFIDFPEVKLAVKDGIVSVRDLPRNRSRCMVSEAMIMAGEAAAKFAMENNIPIPYNSQDAPEVIESPEDLASMYAYRRKLKPGKVNIDPLPHFGLGLDSYCKATSPLRRYGDLLVHQQLRAFLNDKELISAEQLLIKMGSSQIGSNAITKVERLSNLHWKLVYLMQNPEWVGIGIVAAKGERKDDVIIPGLGMETKIILGEDLELNTEIEVKCMEIDLPKLYVRFKKV